MGQYWTVIGSAGLHWAVLGYTGLYWAVLGCTGMYWADGRCTGMNWAGLCLAVLGCAGLYKGVLACDGLYWAVLGWTGVYWAVWAVLDCTGLYWVLVSCTGLYNAQPTAIFLFIPDTRPNNLVALGKACLLLNSVRRQSFAKICFSTISRKKSNCMPTAPHNIFQHPKKRKCNIDMCEGYDIGIFFTPNIPSLIQKGFFGSF